MNDNNINPLGLSESIMSLLKSYTANQAATTGGMKAVGAATKALGTTSMAIKLTDQLLGTFNGNLDTTNVEGGPAMINNILASTLPGFSNLFGKKVKEFKFDPNSSYSSFNKEYTKISGEANKSLMPWMTKSVNNQGENLMLQNNKIKSLKTDFNNRMASISSDDLLSNYLNAMNPKDYNRMSIGKSGIKIFSNERKNWIDHLKETKLFKEGGKMNVIPEGALHARKHEIDSDELNESITSKGIPVISKEDGGEIVQHAEIERNEIIFTLEVTNKLEKLAKNGSDEDAIEAGKLLVKEILYNTDDRTGLINEIE